MILFRGTPEPEDTPKKREFPVVYFAKTKRKAAFYGNYIQEYRTPRLRTVKYRSSAWDKLATDFLGEPLKSSDHKNFFLYPVRQWIEWLSDAGYDAMEDGDYVAVFDPRPIELVERYTNAG